VNQSRQSIFVKLRYGHVYQFRLPQQMVPQYRADIKEQREALGCEMADGIHYCIVISNDDFNVVNDHGVVVIPMTSATDEKGREKFGGKLGGPWVRVIFEGKPAYILCEQIRFIDRRRHVPDFHAKLLDYDMVQVQKKLDSFLKPQFAVNMAA
jgi:mRNA-degrading endonuclease toxin of MazEF toxin-antitoxin module